MNDNPDWTNQYNSAWANSDLLIPKFISKQGGIYLVRNTFEITFPKPFIEIQ